MKFFFVVVSVLIKPSLQFLVLFGVFLVSE